MSADTKPADVNPEWWDGYIQGIEDNKRCTIAGAEAIQEEWTRSVHALCSIFHAATMGVSQGTIATMARNALHVFAPDLPKPSDELLVIDRILEKLKDRTREDERAACLRAVVESGPDTPELIEAQRRIRIRGQQ